MLGRPPHCSMSDQILYLQLNFIPKRLDRAGFFIVLPQQQKRLIVCEHYENNGRLTHVIEGRQAALIAATAVERGFVTQLNHAAYLGRELAKAEGARSNGITYEQDAAPGYSQRRNLSNRRRPTANAVKDDSRPMVNASET
jgi:hypothetical protein